MGTDSVFSCSTLVARFGSTTMGATMASTPSMTATANTGQGVVIMINANDNSRMVSRIRNFVARQYHWPNASAYVAPAAAQLPPAVAAQIAGRYEFANNQMIAFVAHNGRLSVLEDSLPDEDFILVDADHIVSTERNFRVAVVRDASGAVTGLSVDPGRDVTSRAANRAALRRRSSRETTMTRPWMPERIARCELLVREESRSRPVRSLQRERDTISAPIPGRPLRG